MVREPYRGGGGGSDDGDPTPEDAGGEMGRAAYTLRQVKDRLRRLEESRATREDLQGGFRDPEDILTPISRVVDRALNGDRVTVTLQGGATSQYIDDFEDADMNEYSDPNSRSDIRSNPVSQGSYSVAVTSASNGAIDPVVSTNGLPAYPENGDTYRYETLLSSTGESNAHHYFAVDSGASNGYRIDINPGNNTCRVYQINSGSVFQIIDIALSSVPFGEWLQVEIDWDSGGGFEVTVEAADGTELGSGSTTNAAYLSGGIGWGASAAGVQDTRSAFFDFTRKVVSSDYIDDFEDRNITEYSGDTELASVRKSSAIPVEHGTYALQLGATVIDSFEDGDITEYGGDTGSATVKTDSNIPVEDRTHALELDGT